MAPACAGLIVLLCSIAPLSACHGEEEGTAVRDASEPDDTNESPDPDASPDSTQTSDIAEPPTCCPIDDSPSSCMQLGGSESDYGCVDTCDFWCSTNWQVVQNADGCDVWTYDIREPAENENAFCLGDP